MQDRMIHDIQTRLIKLEQRHQIAKKWEETSGMAYYFLN